MEIVGPGAAAEAHALVRAKHANGRPTYVRTTVAENAEARFNRGKKLFESKPPLMSEQDFADLETALRVARSTYDVEMLTARALVAEAWSLKGNQGMGGRDLVYCMNCGRSRSWRGQGSPRAVEEPFDLMGFLGLRA